MFKIKSTRKENLAMLKSINQYQEIGRKHRSTMLDLEMMQQR